MSQPLGAVQPHDGGPVEGPAGPLAQVPRPGAPPWALVRPTNAKAVLAVSLLWAAPAAIVFAVLARREIRRTGEAGWGLATWALGLGIAQIALYALYIAAFVGLYVALIAGALAAGSTTGLD